MRILVLIGIAVTWGLVPAFAQNYKYDENKVYLCFLKIKPEIQSDLEGATDVRMGLSTQPDGLTNVLVTYQRDNTEFEAVVALEIDPCQAAKVVSSKLISDPVEHSNMIKTKFPECYGEQMDWLFPRGTSQIQPQMNLVKLDSNPSTKIQLGTWVKKDSTLKKHVAIFRTVTCGSFGGETDGGEITTFSTDSITGVRCTDSECTFSQS